MHYWGVWRNFIIRILCGETSSLECHPKLDVPLPQGQATRKPSLRQRNGVVKWRREMKRTSTSRLLNALSIICYTFHAPHSLSCNAFLWLSAMRKCSYAHEVTSVVWCQCMQPLSKGRMEEGGGEVDIYVFDFPANYTCLGDSYFRCLEIVCLSGQYTLIIPHRTNQLTIGISFRRKKKREGLLHDDSIILLVVLTYPNWVRAGFFNFLSSASAMKSVSWHFLHGMAGSSVLLFGFATVTGSKTISGTLGEQRLEIIRT